MASKKDQRSIERILNKIDRKEQVFEKRTAFMDSDYDWGWKNTPFVPIATEGIQEKRIRALVYRYSGNGR